MAFFEKVDIHCIPQSNVTEIEERHEDNYLTAVIERQQQIVRTYLRQGGHDVEAIFNERTNKDAIVMDILDFLVGYTLNYSVWSRSPQNEELLNQLTKMYNMKMTLLKEIAQNITPISTEFPDKPEYPSASDERKSKGILGWDDRVNSTHQYP